jgi:23S rRNA G2445 N2-methylase RlmL
VGTDVSRRAPASKAAIRRAVKRRLWREPQAFRAVCAPGLETLLAGEVRTLAGVSEVSTHAGSVRFAAPFDAIYAALLRLRCADDVRVRVGEVPAGSFVILRDHLARLPWSLWLPERCALAVRVRSRASRVRDDAGLERVVRQAVRDHGVDDRAENEPPLTVRLQLSRDRAETWLDAAGTPLHRRLGERWLAPTSLRETTAAALCLAGLDRDADLVVDPFCGSGTLIEEAASLLDGACPGANREFALAASPAWAVGRRRHAQRTFCADERPSPAGLVGFDVDSDAFAAARRNLERAGLSDRVELRRGDARDTPLSDLSARRGVRRPVLLANPPYGRRADARGAEPDALLAQVLEGAAGWRFALLYPRPAALDSLPGVHVERVLHVRIRGLRTALVTGRVGAASDSERDAA